MERQKKGLVEGLKKGGELEEESGGEKGLVEKRAWWRKGPGGEKGLVER